MNEREAPSSYVPRLLASWPDGGQRHRSIDGSLLFVDVSGFTALSERLAKRGPIGAELLTEVLDALFSRMLDEGLRRGADFLKFGGDAVLLMFDGEGHADRAAAAAVAMQATLRRAVTVEGVGRLRLTASMGLHSGHIDLFALGEEYRELVVAGPAVDAVLAAEGEATAGEILATMAAVRALRTATFAEVRHPGRIVRNVAASATAPPPAVGRVIPAFPLLTPPLRSVLDAGTPLAAEHRPAAVGFVKFSGSSRLLAEEGPLATADALQELVVAAHAAAARQDVTLVTIDVNPDGGKVLFVAGAPAASGDDVDRVLLTTLELVEAPGRLHRCGGVNAGRIYVGPLGPAGTRAYAVIGDVVNTAARIGVPAPYGAVLATEATMHLVADAFTYRPAEPIKAKGKKELIRSGRVGLPRGGVNATDNVDLVGRERELGLLRSLVDAVRSGPSGAVAVIEADAGLGKSRLVQELRGMLSGFEVLSAAAGRYAAHDPYRSVNQGLRQLLALQRVDEGSLRAALRARAPEAAEWVGLLAGALRLDMALADHENAISPQRRAQRSHELWSDVLLAGDAPLALLVEDAHWLDGATSDLLDELVRRSQSAPILIVATRRPGPEGWRPDSPHHRLELQPLADDASLSLVRAITGERPLHPDSETQVLRLGHGNAFFLRQLVAADRQGGELPNRVEAVVSRNLDRLDRDSRMLIQTAAVLGASTDLALLAEVTHVDVATLRRRLQGLADYLAVEGDAVEFAHALVRDAAYGQLPYRRRRQLHGRAAAILADRPNPPVPLLAIHHFEAGNDAEAWEYNVAAAKDARLRWAMADAAGCLQRAIAVGRRSRLIPPSAVAQLRLELGEIHVQLGHYDEADAVLAKARRAAPPNDHGFAAMVEAQRCVVRERRSQYREALRRYEKAIELADGLDDVLAKLNVGKAAVLYRLGDLHATRDLLTAVLPRYDQLGLLRPLAHGLKILGTAESELGDTGGVWFSRALEIYEQLGDREGQAGVLNNRASDHLGRGAWADAASDYRRARELYELAGCTVDAAMPALNLGELYLNQGRLLDARALIADSWQRWRAIGYPVGILFAESLTGIIDVRLGQAGGRALLSSAFAELERRGMQGTALLPATGLLEADLAEGRLEAVIDRAAALQDLCEELGQPQFVSQVLRLRGIAECRLGELRAGRRTLAASLGTADLAASKAERAFSLRAVALLADSRHAAEADRLLDELGVVGCYVDRYCAPL